MTGSSSCKGTRFRDLVRRFFGHPDVTHRLVTVRDQAVAAQGVQVGDRVAFSLDGTRRVGFVNRITKRATVLVEDGGGVRYTDGKRYLKFYVPLECLEKTSENSCLRLNPSILSSPASCVSCLTTFRPNSFTSDAASLPTIAWGSPASPEAGLSSVGALN